MGNNDEKIHTAKHVKESKTLPFQALSYPFILSEYDNIIIFIKCQTIIKISGRILNLKVFIANRDVQKEFYNLIR